MNRYTDQYMDQYMMSPDYKAKRQYAPSHVFSFHVYQRPSTPVMLHMVQLCSRTKPAQRYISLGYTQAP